MHTTTRAEKRTTQSGFSLVEMLFVITLTTVVMVSAAGLFFTTLIGNSRSSVQTSVKNEGDYALGRLELRMGISKSRYSPPVEHYSTSHHRMLMQVHSNLIVFNQQSTQHMLKFHLSLRNLLLTTLLPHR